MRSAHPETIAQSARVTAWNTSARWERTTLLMDRLDLKTASCAHRVNTVRWTGWHSRRVTVRKAGFALEGRGKQSRVRLAMQPLLVIARVPKETIQVVDAGQVPTVLKAPPTRSRAAWVTIAINGS